MTLVSSAVMPLPLLLFLPPCLPLALPPPL
jgi:hypothetical protein